MNFYIIYQTASSCFSGWFSEVNPHPPTYRDFSGKVISFMQESHVAEPEWIASVTILVSRHLKLLREPQGISHVTQAELVFGGVCGVSRSLSWPSKHRLSPERITHGEAAHLPPTPNSPDIQWWASEVSLSQFGTCHWQLHECEGGEVRDRREKYVRSWCTKTYSMSCTPCKLRGLLVVRKVKRRHDDWFNCL